MGLHLGWIPNEPGLRPRDFEQRAPSAAGPDPLKVAAQRAAHAARALWTRLLIVIGLLALVLFGLLGVITHRELAWIVGAVIAACCWLPVAQFGWARRRTASRWRRETEEGTRRHVTELAEYERGKALWDAAETERIAGTPRWLRVAAQEDIDRLDVFGGTAQARQNLITGVGQALLENRAVVVVDLSQDRVSAGLIATAYQAGVSFQDYRLPADLPATPLLAGLTGDQIASLIVEVLHADDGNATAAGRATDLMLLRKITRVLGADVTMARLHQALSVLLGDAPGGPAETAGGTETPGPQLTEPERAGLHTLFGAGLRSQVAGNLVRLAAVIEPLADLGADASPRPPARLTCLSLPDGPRDVAADLIAALIVQWTTRSVAAEGGFRPAVILAGADEQSTRHLSRLTTVCERYEIPLVRTFARLTEESARHLDTRHTAFLRLATRPEALRAAEHIGLERRFVAGRFSHSHNVSRSRTRTTGESVTHSTGSTQGEASTHTTGTTTGQAYSEARVPRRDTSVHVQVNNDSGGGPRGGGQRDGGAGQNSGSRAATPSGGNASDRDGKGTAGNGAGARQPEQRGSSGGGWGGGGSGGGGGGGRSSVVSGGGGGGRPAVDVIKTKTQFSARQESDAKTKSWTTTEETSHTESSSQSQTTGTSVGDEITYELVYDHKVEPETLMALPEDQMLAPQVVAGSGAAGALSPGRARPDSKIVALVIDPAVVGSGSAAQVRPDEIPAFEAPAPAVSAHVPDYAHAPRGALGQG